MQFVLSAFLEAPTQELYGIEIGDAAELPSGTVHPILARLEGLGWLESRWEQIDPRQEGRPSRRYYKLTAAGTQGAQEALGPRIPPAPFAAQTLTRRGAAMTPRALAPMSRHIIEFAAQTLPSSSATATATSSPLSCTSSRVTSSCGTPFTPFPGPGPFAPPSTRPRPHRSGRSQ